MELKINKLILERDSYQKKISNLISKIDNYIGLSESFSNKRNDNNNLKIKKDNNNYRLSKLKQELNDLHNKYELGQKEEENAQNKSQQTQNNLITVRLKFVALKTQYRFLKDYNCQIGQYLSEQNKTAKELGDNCLKLKEKIENGKLYSNPTQEEEKLLEQNKEIEQYDKKIKELENLIVKQEQNKRIYKIRYEELQKILNNNNGRSCSSRKGLYYSGGANYKRISSARESNHSQGSNRKMKLFSSFTKQTPISISNINQKKTNNKNSENERPRIEESRRRQFNQLINNKENNVKNKQDEIEKKEIKKEEQIIRKTENKNIISNNKENKFGWLEDDEDNNDVVEELDENKNNQINTIEIKTNQSRRRPFGNFGFSSSP